MSEIDNKDEFALDRQSEFLGLAADLYKALEDAEMDPETDDLIMELIYKMYLLYDLETRLAMELELNLADKLGDDKFSKVYQRIMLEVQAAVLADMDKFADESDEDVSDDMFEA